MTQLSKAKQGRTTPQITSVARAEKIEVALVRSRVAAGQVVIPWNPVHAPRALGIGKGLRVKVNANIGTSMEHCSLAEEVAKAKAAVEVPETVFPLAETMVWTIQSMVFFIETMVCEAKTLFSEA
jgi:phosphomethylpyrimidine synthase